MKSFLCYNTISAETQTILDAGSDDDYHCYSASGYNIVVWANAELIRETGYSWIESVPLIKFSFRVQRVRVPS